MGDTYKNPITRGEVIINNDEFRPDELLQSVC